MIYRKKSHHGGHILSILDSGRHFFIFFLLFQPFILYFYMLEPEILIGNHWKGQRREKQIPTCFTKNLREKSF